MRFIRNFVYLKIRIHFTEGRLFHKKGLLPTRGRGDVIHVSKFGQAYIITNGGIYLKEGGTIIEMKD
jgi:hypothetical protein